VAKKVLIVEDVKATRDTIVFLFTNRGYEVTEAVDGDDALAKVKSVRPDLVVLDSEIPGRSGYDVFRLLKEDPATRPTPVLMLVADTDAFDMPTRSIPPAQFLVTKPFKAHDLLSRAAQILG
jgi:CheY-like chemotaxis protein